MGDEASLISYAGPSGGDKPVCSLVMVGGREKGRTFPFYDRIEIGRHRDGPVEEGRLTIRDTTVSSRHCVITREPNGRFFVQDLSRNGTRLDGRRLSPNILTELAVGQVVSVGVGHQFRLKGELARESDVESVPEGGTEVVDEVSVVTILVGDVTDYTTMTQEADPTQLRSSMGRVFARLEEEVARLGGTVKEFQGDAIFAFWERVSWPDYAERACVGALRLQEVVSEMAADPNVWCVKGFSLNMDWALSTGLVAMSAHGTNHAVGLSMVGEPVVLAFRIEKLASPETGHIIACPRTRAAASPRFLFREIGRHQVKGLTREWELYSLVGEGP